MTKIGWATDIHLSVCDDKTRQRFYQEICDARLDQLWFGGDIGEADNIEALLIELLEAVEIPTFFVLGNHDFYFGSIMNERWQIGFKATSVCGVFKPCPSPRGDAPGRTGGHDGWSDGRIGNYETSMVMMHDYRHIQDLAEYGKLERWEMMKEQGDVARHLYDVLPEAMQRFKEVFLVTHAAAAGSLLVRRSDSRRRMGMPHFTCKAVGDAILDIASQYGDTHLTVLCGHTHSPEHAIHRPM